MRVCTASYGNYCDRIVMHDCMYIMCSYVYCVLCSDGGGAIIEGLEVELKKIDDGNFLLLQVGDAPRELKVVTPSNILTEISKCEHVLC